MKMRCKNVPQNIVLEHVSCDFCGCAEYKVRYRKPDTWLWLNQFEFPVVECVNCGLVYVNPRPTQDSMSVYYPKNYHDDRDSNEHIERYLLQTEYLPKLTSEKVLDIGCARGDFLIYLKKLYPHIELYGVDFFSDKVNSKEIFFINKLLQDCNFKDSEFDIITAWAVFEHLHTPSIYFEEVSRILKKYGKFIFLVTNSESLYGKKAYVEDVPRHTYHFSEKSLRNYAEKYGFEFTSLHYDDRFWDGRGTGTFHYQLQKFSGVTWEKRYFHKLNLIQKGMSKFGSSLDGLIFKNHWEAKRKRSGIIIAEFTKK